MPLAALSLHYVAQTDAITFSPLRPRVPARAPRDHNREPSIRQYWSSSSVTAILDTAGGFRGLAGIFRRMLPSAPEPPRKPKPDYRSWSRWAPRGRGLAETASWEGLTWRHCQSAPR